MFCFQCGAQVEGNFCWQCGTRLQAAPPSNPKPPPLPIDESREIRYEVLLAIPEVREEIARAAAQSTKKMSAEKFLELCDKAFQPLAGFPMAALVSVVQPLYAKMGIKTGKTRTERIRRPPGSVLKAVLCSLARNAQPIRKVDQAADGCFLQADLPSDMFSFAGDLYVSVAADGQGTKVEAATHIPGQLFDWGKSRSCLDALFAELNDHLRDTSRRAG